MRAELVLALAALGLTLAAGCATAPPPAGAPPLAPDDAPRMPTDLQAFELVEQARARALQAQGRLAEAALAWEALSLVDPGNPDYLRQLDRARRQAADEAAERLRRAAQAAARGEPDAAAREALGALAAEPDNAAAAELLRSWEVDRNRRQHLGRYTRNTLTRRAMAQAEMREMRSPALDRNEMEHATMLLAQGEFSAAISLLERRLAADRRDAGARRLLADAYARQAEALRAAPPGVSVQAREASAGAGL